MIVNGLVEFIEKYVYILGIILEIIVFIGERDKINIFLIKGGFSLDSLVEINFYEKEIELIE